MDKIEVYIYSSCHFSDRTENNEPVGDGGFGIVMTRNGIQVDEIVGGYSSTTNARLDIIGITETIRKVKKTSDITFYISNGYVIDTITKGWLEKWKREGFKKKKHVDLWKALDKELFASVHVLSFKLSKEVRFKKEFQLAEKLAKTMSGKNNLPPDLQSSEVNTNLFGQAESDNIPTEAIDHKVPDMDSICVDASTIENPGPTEYRGVDTKTRQILFQRKYQEATNNIGEFLAIVHALALFKKQGKQLKIIYSDSINAISWVSQKKCKTKYQQTENNQQLFDDIKRAVSWLEKNTYETKILKWKTEIWGEIPADYGRK